MCGLLSVVQPVSVSRIGGVKKKRASARSSCPPLNAATNLTALILIIIRVVQEQFKVLHIPSLPCVHPKVPTEELLGLFKAPCHLT